MVDAKTISPSKWVGPATNYAVQIGDSGNETVGLVVMPMILCRSAQLRQWVDVSGFLVDNVQFVVIGVVFPGHASFDLRNPTVGVVPARRKGGVENHVLNGRRDDGTESSEQDFVARNRRGNTDRCADHSCER